tara:strand:+ start:579 stop:965 length:387 start_codon:yes stop_codon:yes gene_type:complete
MKKLLLIFPLLILGCAENLDEEITYKQEINWIANKSSAIVRTKYFSGKLNYIFDLTIDSEECIFDPFVIYKLYFADEDSFNIYVAIPNTNLFVQDNADECKLRFQDAVPLDKELYKRISKLRIGTLGN